NVTISDLTSILNPTINNRKLRKQIKQIDNFNTEVKVAPTTFEGEKQERKAAYKNICKSISKWDDVVRLHNSPDHLVFPITRPNNALQEASSDLVNFSSISTKSDLEKKVDALLGKDTNVSNKVKKTQAELNESLYRSFLEEANQYRAQVSSFKVRMGTMSKLNHLHKKSKSKRQRKIQRKIDAKSQVHTAESVSQVLEKVKVNRAT
ncbi:MAG: U3 small nucleolar RNA-associated protein 14 A, partial [Paramarteilia canceri]